MRGSINVKSPNNINNWQMRFNSAFKGLMEEWGRVPSLRVLPWHLPYNWGKSTKHKCKQIILTVPHICVYSYTFFRIIPTYNLCKYTDSSMGCKTEESKFDSQHGQQIFVLSTVPRRAPRTTQSPRTHPLRIMRPATTDDHWHRHSDQQCVPPISPFPLTSLLT
jgi:hypothetical protein